MSLLICHEMLNHMSSSSSESPHPPPVSPPVASSWVLLSCCGGGVDPSSEEIGSFCFFGLVANPRMSSRGSFFVSTYRGTAGLPRMSLSGSSCTFVGSFFSTENISSKIGSLSCLLGAVCSFYAIENGA